MFKANDIVKLDLPDRKHVRLTGNFRVLGPAKRVYGFLSVAVPTRQLIPYSVPDYIVCAVSELDAELLDPTAPETYPVILGGTRSDGYHFYLHRSLYTPIIIRAGCRSFDSFPMARAWWRATRDGTDLGDESQAMLDHMEKEAKQRGWIH